MDGKPDASEHPTDWAILNFLSSQSQDRDDGDAKANAEADKSSTNQVAEHLLSSTKGEDMQGIGADILYRAQVTLSDWKVQRLAEFWSAVKERAPEKDDDKMDWAIREHWNYFDPPDDDADQAEAREAWRRLNLFTATLAAQGDGSVLLNGLWTLRSALEDEDGIEGNLPAAAAWAVNAGDAIFTSSESFGSDGTKGPAKPGKKFNGEGGFSRERWDFWKNGFSSAEEDSRLSDRSRDWARKAVEAMGKIESGSA